MIPGERVPMGINFNISVGMKRVVCYKYRSNNSSQYTVAVLECGHERVFEYGTYPKTARCWICQEEDKDGR